MNDSEIRQYIRKHGRGEVLKAIFEGLSTYEAADLIRASRLTIHPCLLALTGEEFKDMDVEAKIVSARFGRARPEKQTRKKYRGAVVQAFSINYDVLYTPHGKKVRHPDLAESAETYDRGEVGSVPISQMKAVDHGDGTPPSRETPIIYVSPEAVEAVRKAL